MNDTGKRALGYGSGAVVAAALVWAGFAYRAEPDVLTMLGAVDVQLRLASTMPEREADGAAVAAREDLLASARGYLERLERIEPDSLPAAEFRAYLEYLEGDFLEAADLYGRALGLKGCTADVRDALVMNRAKAFHRAGRSRDALAVLEGHRGAFLPANAGAARLERARLLRELGRTAEAAATAGQLDGLSRPADLLSAGKILESCEAWDGAERAFARASRRAPVAHYFLARLKMREGRTDSALKLLERAVRAAGSEATDRLVRRDRRIWGPVADSEGFRSLMRSDRDASRVGKEPGRESEREEGGHDR